MMMMITVVNLIKRGKATLLHQKNKQQTNKNNNQYAKLVT